MNYSQSCEFSDKTVKSLAEKRPEQYNEKQTPTKKVLELSN